jgi:ribA/ribD-fused uncharacterized protein
MQRVIDKFIDEEFFLSNFYISPIIFNGKEYKTVEHAFQASKADNESEHEWIRFMDTPGKAKRNGHKVHMRKDWEQIKFDLMLELLRIKFSDPVLREKLKSTKNYELIEGNYWHDNIFGNCTCQDCRRIIGENKLGKMLMKVRDEIIDL